ncbi:MAG: LITAF-like zinc ribbon domain-containing protein [Thermoplasmatota archaeon]
MNGVKDKFRTLHNLSGGSIERYFVCPYCNTYSTPRSKEQISQTGWIVFAILLIAFWPLFWIGLLMKEKITICGNCSKKLTQYDLSAGYGQRAPVKTSRVVDVPSDHTLRQARNYEAAERWEDAAILYEKMGMWEEAGRCRRRGKGEVVKHINVNANELFTQIKRDGLAVPYTCPTCGGNIQIDGRDQMIRRCPYCGTGVDTNLLYNAMNELVL